MNPPNNANPYRPGSEHPSFNLQGTRTDRVPSDQENKSNTPKQDRPSHPELVEKLCKKPEALLEEWTKEHRKVHLLHMASKLVSEAGEIAECIYAHVYYDKELDIDGKDGIIKEMGDLEFYLEGIRAPLEISREEVLRRNINKLLIRYGGLTYSNEAAIARVDKAEPVQP